jgi:hypothetical protein
MSWVRTPATDVGNTPTHDPDGSGLSRTRPEPLLLLRSGSSGDRRRLARAVPVAATSGVEA